MLTSVESDYIKSLVSTYMNHGFKYYMVHSITDSNNDYDMCLYMSKNKIEALSDNYFQVEKGIRVYIDSSSKSNYHIDTRDDVDSFNGYVTVDIAEFIYTNAISDYSYNTLCLNPDFMVNFQASKYDVINCYLIVIMFLFIVISKLFKLGG